MITGAHTVIYSTDPDKDRGFLRDVLKFPSIDSGDGWLIFSLPPSEVAIHPSEKSNFDEFFLLCDDVNELIVQMRSLKVKCSKVQRHEWGLLTKVKLPGGGFLKIYQPLHARPKPEQ